MATTITVSLLLHGPISRKVATTLCNSQTTALDQNGAASARFNWDVRLAASVARASDTELVLNSRDGSTITYCFDIAAHTLSRTKQAESATLLKDVASVSFSLYKTPALYDQIQPATPANARIVGLKWTSLGAASGISNPQRAIATLQ